mmetsp:Transcript_183/g.279  ORF Transcript_183/g.279 Transcript_183/m.279 type:complete len:228 (-) Transcript_183:202-885(-)
MALEPLRVEYFGSKFRCTSLLDHRLGDFARNIFYSVSESFNILQIKLQGRWLNQILYSECVVVCIRQLFCSQRVFSSSVAQNRRNTRLLFFDLLKNHRFFLGLFVDQTQCNTLSTASCSPTNSVSVRLPVWREVYVHDKRDTPKVEASGNPISGVFLSTPLSLFFLVNFFIVTVRFNSFLASYIGTLVRSDQIIKIPNVELFDDVESASKRQFSVQYGRTNVKLFQQ